MHLNSLSKNLAPDLFLYNGANSVPESTADSSSFAMATWVEQSFPSEQRPCLDLASYGPVL